MRTGPDLLIAANDALLLLHEKIATHDARVYEAIKNCVEGVTTEVVFDDGTVLSTKIWRFIFITSTTWARGYKHSERSQNHGMI